MLKYRTFFLYLVPHVPALFSVFCLLIVYFLEENRVGPAVLGVLIEVEGLMLQAQWSHINELQMSKG